MLLIALKEKYIAETQKREAKLQKLADWELPEILNFGGNFMEFETKLSAMKPFYYDNKWKTEEAFIKFLENQIKLIGGLKMATEMRHFLPFHIPRMTNKTILC